MAAGPALLLLALPAVVPQGFSDEVWGDWDSVKCYACGLKDVDPETDSEGTYGTNPGESKKMYNHSCDLMDNGIKGLNLLPPGKPEDDKPGEGRARAKAKEYFEYSGQELEPRNHVSHVNWTRKVMENGTVKEECVTRYVVTSTTNETSNETVTERTPETICVPVFITTFNVTDLPPKKYDLNMWERKCPSGVRSCFWAEGNWADQKPTFRGCSGVKYEHGTSCKRELQRVQTQPGRPKVDVEVLLCYCTADNCNTIIESRAGRPLLRVGGFINSIIHGSLLAALLLVALD